MIAGRFRYEIAEITEAKKKNKKTWIAAKLTLTMETSLNVFLLSHRIICYFGLGAFP